jgi:hypothetical protein
MLVALLLVSCGKNNTSAVKAIKIQEHIINDKVYLELKATFDLGGKTLWPATLPIIVKKKQIGNAEIGTDFVKLNFAMSDIVSLQLQDSTLPNGTGLPLISDNKVVVIPIGAAGKFELYISLTAGAKAIGFTLPVAELDALGASLKYTAYMPPVKLGDFTVFGGVYTSPVAGENGVGVFADLKPVFTRLRIQGLCRFSGFRT